MTPTKDNAMLALADERSLFEAADKAYFKAGETSDPQHWLEAALLARQHRNALTKLRALRLASTPAASGVGEALECARQAIEYSIEMGGADPGGVLLQALNKCDRALRLVNPLTWDASTSVAGLDGGGVA